MHPELRCCVRKQRLTARQTKLCGKTISAVFFQTSLSLALCLSRPSSSSLALSLRRRRSSSLSLCADRASAQAWARPDARWKARCSCWRCPRSCLLCSGARSGARSEMNTWMSKATLLTSLERAIREAWSSFRGGGKEGETSEDSGDRNASCASCSDDLPCKDSAAV